MTDPVEIIEEPAKRPRPIEPAFGIVAALMFVGLGAVGTAWTIAKPQSSPTVCFAPSIVFGLAIAAYAVYKSNRWKKRSIAWSQEASSAVHFRMEGAVDLMVSAWGVGSISSIFVPAVLSIANWSMSQVVLDLVSLAWTVAASSLLYAIMSRSWSKPGRDFVIDWQHEIVHIPAGAQQGRRRPAADVSFSKIRAVVIQRRSRRAGGRLLLVADNSLDGDFVLRYTGTFEGAYLDGKWISDQLSVPLLQWSVSDSRRRPPE